jgi:hypothetical protein
MRGEAPEMFRKKDTLEIANKIVSIIAAIVGTIGKI